MSEQLASATFATSMHDEFHGRLALITAAAGDGIGHAVARRLAAGGASLVITDSHERRTEQVVASLERDYPGRVTGYTMDVSDFARVDEVFDAVQTNIGPVTILVNNAAATTFGDIFEFSLTEFQRILTIDLTACWYLGKKAGEHMKAAGGGAIVNISSIASDRGSAAYEPPYAAAKGGLNALTRGFAKAGGPSNIRCNAVTMGIIVGSHFDRTHPDIAPKLVPEVPLGRHPTSADIAEAVAFLASDRSALMTGEILNVCGGYYFRQ